MMGYIFIWSNVQSYVSFLRGHGKMRGDNSFFAFLEKVILFKKLYLYDMLTYPPTMFPYEYHGSRVIGFIAMQQ